MDPTKQRPGRQAEAPEAVDETTAPIVTPTTDNPRRHRLWRRVEVDRGPGWSLVRWVPARELSCIGTVHVSGRRRTPEVTPRVSPDVSTSDGA